MIWNALKTIDKNRVIGYIAGIASGISYGFNPFFAKRLLENDVPVYSMLFFRYIIAALVMGLWMVVKREKFAVRRNQLLLLALLGFLFAFSSIGLFESYNYMPAGLATTVVYLYPVFTALLMIFKHQYPSWMTWCAMAITMIGVFLMCAPSGSVDVKAVGVILASAAALLYAIYLMIVNTSKRIIDVTPHTLTFYALIFGSLIFVLITLAKGNSLTQNLNTAVDWLDILGLAIIPTMISMLTLAISTRRVGATKTAILGVFEPITAIIIGVIAFSETITVTITIGLICCVTAIVFMVTQKR